LNNDNGEELKGVPLSDHNDALIEFGKDSLKNSISVIKEHIKLMIPLTTGLITSYLAVLQFLGIKTASNTSKLTPGELVYPAIIMFWSLVIFLIVSFPILKRLNINSLPSIIAYRNFHMIWKYAGTSLGMGVFLYGLFNMIIVVQNIITIHKP
jgi:hypothetical protein